MQRLRFALIGCGRIAERHAQILATSDFSNLVGVCDVDAGRAERLGHRHGAPWFESIGAMLEAVTPDVVNVLTPSGLHARHTLGLAGQIPNIVVEKPMALRLADADAMIDACARKGSRLFVVQQNRFNVAIRKLREALEEGRFGRLVLGAVRVRWCRTQAYYDLDAWRGTWALDGGVLANQASHHVDMLQWMLGEPLSVFARATTRLVEIEAEDTAAVVLTFDNGALGLIEATTATRPKDIEGSLSILGEHGSVEVGGFAMNEIKTWQFERPATGDAGVFDRYRENPEDVYGFGHHQYLRHVAACIENGEPGLVEGLEGRRSLELLSAIYESIETERAVALRFRPTRCRLGQNRAKSRVV